MQTEIEIRSILRDSRNAEAMADNICSFMNWDRDELLRAIKKHGCSDNQSRGKVIDEFWGKHKT